MKDYDIFELHDAEDIDAAFAATFGLEHCTWAEYYDQDAVTDFLEGFSGERKVWRWIIELRNWNRGNNADYMATISSKHNRGGVWLGHSSVGFSDYACHALMKAAIEWGQRRREIKREKALAKREADAASSPAREL